MIMGGKDVIFALIFILLLGKVSFGVMQNNSSFVLVSCSSHFFVLFLQSLSLSVSREIKREQRLLGKKRSFSFFMLLCEYVRMQARYKKKERRLFSCPSTSATTLRCAVRHNASVYHFSPLLNILCMRLIFFFHLGNVSERNNVCLFLFVSYFVCTLFCLILFVLDFSS